EQLERYNLHALLISLHLLWRLSDRPPLQERWLAESKQLLEQLFTRLHHEMPAWREVPSTEALRAALVDMLEEPVPSCSRTKLPLHEPAVG
ncbi:unnamed protein product, partial [Symbiodinium sp. KB8]